MVWLGAHIKRETMSKLKSLLISNNTSSWVEFPDIDGFKVHLQYITKEELIKIRNASLVFKFSKKTRQREETVDNDKFLEKYAEKAILGWAGLQIKHLPMLLPVDISGMNPDEPVEYTPEDALDLLSNSTVFDQFVSDALSDFENFTRDKAEADSKN